MLAENGENLITPQPGISARNAVKVKEARDDWSRYNRKTRKDGAKKAIVAEKT